MLGLFVCLFVFQPDSTYNACKLAMKHAAERRGALFVQFPLPLPLRSRQEVLDAYARVIDEQRAQGRHVRFMLADAISSPTAIVLPWLQLGDLAREKGVECMIDAAHGVGCIDLDLSEARVDYLTTNAHKWAFSPKGSALLYAAPAVQANLHPSVTSHSHGEDWRRRFWMQATRADCAYVASAEALHFLNAVGVERIRAHGKKLLDYATEQVVQRVWNGQAPTDLFICPASMHAPTMRLLRLPWPVAPAMRHSIGDRLMTHFMREFGVVLPFAWEPHSGALWMRLSAQMYNNERDYDRVVDALLAYEKNPMPEQGMV